MKILFNVGMIYLILFYHVAKTIAPNAILSTCPYDSISVYMEKKSCILPSLICMNGTSNLNGHDKIICLNGTSNWNGNEEIKEIICIFWFFWGLAAHVLPAFHILSCFALLFVLVSCKRTLKFIDLLHLMKFHIQILFCWCESQSALNSLFIRYL